MDQTLQALQALYSSPDPVTKKQADDWLTQFQQTPAAWQVCDQILTRADTPSQYRFFAAQTMRTKVQFDFYELPLDSYASLRDSIISHLERFAGNPESQPIHTMLAIAVADLGIQMDEAWPNPIGTLFERFGKTPEQFSTLLELLRMFPEEVTNYKLMTDTRKRDNSRCRLQAATSQVVQFLLTLPCPSASAKRKVLETFLSWAKFTNLQAGDIAQTAVIPDCFKYVVEGGELGETATDIIVEVIKMCSADLTVFQPVIQLVLSQLDSLRLKLDALFTRGEAAVVADQNSLLQICRIYTETGETLMPLILTQCQNPEVLGILQVILRCTGVPVQEISSIPLEFWHGLADEVCRHPETDMKIDQFKSIYVELLGTVLQRCVFPAGEDPFVADDEFIEYRQQLLNLAGDCLEILTPNCALEQVLKSLQTGQSQGVAIQEAHFFCLTKVGERAEVREESVLWALIQSLPPLIAQQVGEDNTEGAFLHFTKKTAIDLLGRLSKWVRSKPDFLRSSLEMISTLLLMNVPPGSSMNVLERTKQVQQAASISFNEICKTGRYLLPDFLPQLTQLYVSTMPLPIRMHLYIVEGVAAVVADLRADDAFRHGLEALVMPLVTGLNSEREKPQTLSEILDRLTTIIHLIKVKVIPGSAKAADVGRLISNTFWPLIQQTLATHPGDAKVVEKSCRLLKHSMRCVPDLFKPNVPAVATTLVSAFQACQHSSFLYSAEILADTYGRDPEIIPVLTQLFHQLSATGLQCLAASRDRLEEITELVEDFYGMFERFLRYAPMIVLEAPTLPPTLQLWLIAIFVQQKDAIEAVVAFIESSCQFILDSSRQSRGGFPDDTRVRQGQMLRMQVLQVCPGLVQAIFKLIAGVPTKYVQDMLPSVLHVLREVFRQEFSAWLEAGLLALPPSAASQAERRKLGEQILQGDKDVVHDAVDDICYRCEQVALRSRGSSGKT